MKRTAALSFKISFIALFILATVSLVYGLAINTPHPERKIKNNPETEDGYQYEMPQFVPSVWMVAR